MSIDLAVAFLRCYVKAKRREEAYARHGEWESHQHDKLDKWAETYNRNADSLRRIDANLEKLNLELAEVRNPNRRQVVEERITRDTEQLKRLEDWNRDLQNKIEDVECRLSGKTPPTRISIGGAGGVRPLSRPSFSRSPAVSLNVSQSFNVSIKRGF